MDQSALAGTFTKAAAAERLKVTINKDALLKGFFFRSDHFPFARAGVPGLSLESGLTFVGKPAEYGQKLKDEYTEKRYHQPSDEILPWFNYDGAAQQLRVIVRTAVAVADANRQPQWSPESEFREAGKKREAKQD